MDGITHTKVVSGKGSSRLCRTLPWHGWEYDVRDGQHQSIPAVQVPIFQVRVTGDSLEVNLS